MTQNVTYYSERLKTSLQAMLKSPLTVVEAPMGYGKSVAVDGFLRDLSVGLVATKARESAPEVFWPDFCRALAKEVPHAGDVAASLAKLGLPHDIAQTGAALELFRQVYFPRQTFLVFDDCHLLPRSFVDFCESLAGCALPNLRLVCITQHSWAGGREFLRARNAPSLIDRHVLALTPAEIRAYFALFAVSISTSVAQELHASTGGWISAVYLGLLWYREHGDLADFPKNVAARMKETIRETVYAPLSNEARCLLFALLPLEPFTDGQALRLHGEDASSLLLELTRKNAFVVFDLKSKTYSLHAIFRQFLLDEFHAEGVLTDARRREIYRACGDAQQDAGELAAAMESWYKAEAFEHALAVLESDMSRHLVTERAALYTALFKDCPQEILERHIGASFKYALAAFSAGDFAAFATQMRYLSGHCAALPPGKEGDRWRGELHVLLALTAFNDIAAMSAHHRKAFALLGEPTGLYGQDSPWTLGCPSVLFMFYRESGGLREELALMRECMPHYYRLTSRHGAGAEFLMEAEALFCAGDFARAGEVLAHGQGMAERHNQLGNEFCALFLRLRLAFVAGDAAALFGDGEQDGLLAVMRGLILRGRDYFLLYTADLCEGWLYALLGLPEKIPQWLFLPLGGESPLYSFARGFFYLVQGRAGLLAGNHAAIIEGFEATLASGEFAKNLLFSVYAHIYLAAALQETGRNSDAAAALKIALDTALPDALYMPFAENYDLIGSLLGKASSKSRKDALAHIKALAGQLKTGRATLIEEMRARALLHGEDQATGDDDLKKFHAFNARYDLTEKEIEIFTYILRNLSVREMAERMDITRSGIEYHIANLFGKTGVNRQRHLRQLYATFSFADDIRRPYG